MSDTVHDAARKGDLSRLRVLLEQDPGLVNARCNNGSTPLHYAAMNGQAEAVELLHKLGAEVNATNNNGETPLHLVAMWGKPEAAELLHKLGAEVNARNNYGETPLHLVAAWGKTEAAKLLGELGADPEARDNQGRTPLDKAYNEEDKALLRKLMGTPSSRYVVDELVVAVMEKAQVE
jgi:ankyrin repeat protein